MKMRIALAGELPVDQQLFKNRFIGGAGQWIFV